MPKIRIKRPNGTREEAELTRNKSDIGNSSLTLKVMYGGVPYYAKLGSSGSDSTHMYVKKNGYKYYVQKEIVKPVPAWTEKTFDELNGTKVPVSGNYQVFYSQYNKMHLDKTVYLYAGDTFELTEGGDNETTYEFELKCGGKTIYYFRAESESPDELDTEIGGCYPYACALKRV